VATPARSELGLNRSTFCGPPSLDTRRRTKILHRTRTTTVLSFGSEKEEDRAHNDMARHELKVDSNVRFAMFIIVCLLKKMWVPCNFSLCKRKILRVR
jgi:hypothetical protein